MDENLNDKEDFKKILREIQDGNGYALVITILNKVEPYVNYIRSGRVDTHMKNYGGCVSKRGV